MIKGIVPSSRFNISFPDKVISSCLIINDRTESGVDIVSHDHSYIRCFNWHSWICPHYVSHCIALIVNLMFIVQVLSKSCKDKIWGLYNIQASLKVVAMFIPAMKSLGSFKKALATKASYSSSLAMLPSMLLLIKLSYADWSLMNGLLQIVSWGLTINLSDTVRRGKL